MLYLRDSLTTDSGLYFDSKWHSELGIIILPPLPVFEKHVELALLYIFIKCCM